VKRRDQIMKVLANVWVITRAIFLLAAVNWLVVGAVHRWDHFWTVAITTVVVLGLAAWTVRK